MKESGIVRRLDDLGRMVIPKELRRSYGIADGDLVEFCGVGNGILVKPMGHQCVVCGVTAQSVLIEKNGVFICRPCIDELHRER